MDLSIKGIVALVFLFYFNPFEPGAVAQQLPADPEPSSFTPFHVLKTDEDGDGMADMIGDTVTVAGVANIATGQLHEVYLQIFIQNDTTGMSLFTERFDTPVARGDSIVATGIVQQYYGLVEVHVSDYRVFKHPRSSPTPVALKRAVYDPSTYEGMLVEGEGIVVGKGSRFNGKYLSITPADDGSRSIMVYVSNFHSQYREFDFETISTGDKVYLTGVMTIYNPEYPDERTYKIYLRTPDDFQVLGIAQSTLIVLGSIAVVLSVVVVGWIVTLQTRVKSKTRQIRKSLDEKEVLLKEIHHRVKNNLAIISGLIELQMHGSRNEETQKVLRDSLGRIKSMALVHDKLYRTSTLTDIGMETYIVELVQALKFTFAGPESDIDISFDIDPVSLDIEKAIPCGLLVNELVVNAFKHAFNGSGDGNLNITLKRKEKMLSLQVKDNGTGLPEDMGSGESLGMMLIKTFATQLGAEMEMKNRQGACFIFTFPAGLPA